VDAFFWAALGLFVVALVAGGAFLGARVWGAWRAFASLADAAGTGVAQLTNRIDRLAAHGERSTARIQELSEAVERLRQTHARAMVLVGAVAEVTDAVRAVRAFVPR
jgi:alanine dehydrogenase